MQSDINVGPFSVHQWETGRENIVRGCMDSQFQNVEKRGLKIPKILGRQM